MSDIAFEDRAFAASAAGTPPRPVHAHYVGAAVALAAAATLELALPLGIDGPPGAPSALLVAALTLGAAIATLVWARRRIVARLRDMDPSRPETALVTDGPYARSRNPVQLALAAGIVGASALFSLDWGVFAAIGYLVWLRRAVIPAEEARMQARFGAAWDEYRARVNRWV